MTKEILFRLLGAPVPSWSLPDVRWSVELYCDEMAYPVAQAWVMEMFDGAHYLDWIKVDPEYRRKGLATELLAAIRGKFGSEVYSSGVTPEGAALIESAAAKNLIVNDDEDQQ